MFSLSVANRWTFAQWSLQNDGTLRFRDRVLPEGPTRTRMNCLTSIALFLTLCISAAEPVKLPPPRNFHLFLLIGQSNMAGRGVVEDQDKTPHPRVLMFSKAGEWVPATDPMHFDKPVTGTGLGKTFATILAEDDPTLTIGLIPCAVGGSPIDAWQPGVFYEPTKNHPWDDAMQRAHAALKAGVLKGILWHQGESDSTETLAPVYQGKLHELIRRVRSALNAPGVPFIAGQMGLFADASWSEWKVMVDRAHRELPAQVKHTAYVSSQGLEHKGDKAHFSAASYREFGKRYAAAYRALRK
jgi:hypothetical protein